MKITLLAIAATLLVSAAAPSMAHPVASDSPQAGPEQLMDGYPDFAHYEGSVTGIVDGRTLKVDVMVWPGRIMSVDIAASGISSPSDGDPACDLQVILARDAERTLERNFPVGTPVYVDRLVAEAGALYGDVLRWKEGSGFQSVADVLLERSRLAARIELGSAPHDWCAGEE